MKNRILISNIIVLFLLIFSKPDSFLLFYIGLFFVILGEIIRLIASACIRKNNILTVNGIYSMTRNPLYLGTFIIAFGILIQIFSLSHILLSILLWLFVIFSFSIIYYKTIKSEEEFLLSKFGNDYLRYLREVPSILPDLKKIKEVFKKENYSKQAFLKNKEYRGLFGVLIVETIIFIKLCLK